MLCASFSFFLLTENLFSDRFFLFYRSSGIGKKDWKTVSHNCVTMFEKARVG